MSEAQAAKQPRTASDDAEREAFIAAVEDGLADLKAGRTYTHAEVQAEMRRRFPPPTKRRSGLLSGRRGPGASSGRSASTSRETSPRPRTGGSRR